MDAARTILPHWLLSNTILLYKKNGPLNLNNYISIALVNAMRKLRATCPTLLATDYIEAQKIASPEQEGLQAGRPCSKIITHLNLCIEDAHTHNKGIPIA